MASLNLVIRPARAGDGASVFEITRDSVAGLAGDFYSEQQIINWMGERTPEFYENLISHGRMFVAVREDGRAVGFVDTVPGEVTRMFILPEAAGQGLGSHLLALGIAKASEGFSGPITVEATLNAVRFYEKHGFVALHRSISSHAVGGATFEIMHMELVK
ncbi:GNAT family N-acetyltransferase [Defluviimonas sp. WL0024]|uniref:GNAT family N-acetyltransferase n=2 Tax=Albidovulum TaxID=205889 RepID=A0ABT3J6A0_9RHOB|nr:MULTISPECIES: GNAT family N-acetyltransferase [Defluviimonas]MCU9849971.1 GNAT family N-acetyltransferase [Defluviimonas sp. WL0024]MCW3783214.1 GNAT family N-acetyltransferase [Defluviimonas salinarum]